MDNLSRRIAALSPKQPKLLKMRLKNRIKLRYYDISNASFGDGSEKKTRLEEIKTEDRKEKFDLREVPFRVRLANRRDCGQRTRTMNEDKIVLFVDIESKEID